MTDHELNAKMGELCEIPQRTDEETYGAGHAPCTAPFLCGRDLFCPHPDGGCQRLSEPWNPVGDWGQVMEYVVKTMADKFCDFHLAWEVPLLELSFTVPCSGYQCRVFSRKPRRLVEVPRAICEAALEAWEKREAAG